MLLPNEIGNWANSSWWTQILNCHQNRKRERVGFWVGTSVSIGGTRLNDRAAPLLVDLLVDAQAAGFDGVAQVLRRKRGPVRNLLCDRCALFVPSSSDGCR